MHSPEQISFLEGVLSRAVPAECCAGELGGPGPRSPLTGAAGWEVEQQLGPAAARRG